MVIVLTVLNQIRAAYGTRSVPNYPVSITHTNASI